MKRKIAIVSILSFIVLMPKVHAASFDFCVQSSAIWQLFGYILLALKIIIPVVIIVFGTIDFAKAIINEKDNNLSNATIILIRRICIGIFIFFIPTIVSAIFGLMARATEALEAGKACNACLNNPNGDDCAGYKSQAKVQRLG